MGRDLPHALLLLIVISVSCVFMATATSCGNSTGNTTRNNTGWGSGPVTVAVSLVISVFPTSASLPSGGTQQFTATVTGTTNTAVSWSSTGGSISSAGLYTAPSAAGTYTVTATSAADASKSASATVSISAGAPVVSIAVTPTSGALAIGGSQQFTATVSGTSNTGVTWQVTGGTISTAGLYTAPTTAGSYTVTAISMADSTKSASATIAVSAPIQHRVDLSWTGTASGAGYRVYRGGQSAGPYTLLNATLLSTASYSDTRVQSGQTYYYVTTAVSTAGVESAYSNQATVTIPSP